MCLCAAVGWESLVTRPADVGVTLLGPSYDTRALGPVAICAVSQTAAAPH